MHSVDIKSVNFPINFFVRQVFWSRKESDCDSNQIMTTIASWPQYCDHRIVVIIITWEWNHDSSMATTWSRWQQDFDHRGNSGRMRGKPRLNSDTGEHQRYFLPLQNSIIFTFIARVHYALATRDKFASLKYPTFPKMDACPGSGVRVEEEERILLSWAF